MRLRATCKCGAELELRAMAGTVGEVWELWDALHARCYGLQRVRVVAGQQPEADFVQDYPQQTTEASS